MSIDVLKYYQGRQGTGLPLYLAIPLLIILLPFILLAIIIGLLSIPVVALKEKIWPPKAEPRPDDYWSSRQIKLVVGYDSADEESRSLAEQLEQAYPKRCVIYDWHETRRQKVDDLLKQAPDEQTRMVIRTLATVEDDCCSLVPAPLDAAEDDPCTLYVVGLVDEEHPYMEFITALPRLDEWYDPTKILPNEQILQDVNDFMSQKEQP